MNDILPVFGYKKCWGFVSYMYPWCSDVIFGKGWGCEGDGARDVMKEEGGTCNEYWLISLNQKDLSIFKCFQDSFTRSLNLWKYSYTVVVRI